MSRREGVVQFLGFAVFAQRGVIKLRSLFRAAKSYVRAWVGRREVRGLAILFRRFLVPAGVIKSGAETFVTESKIRRHSLKFAKFHDGGCRIALQESMAKILASSEPIWSAALDFAILANRGVEIVLFFEGDGHVVACVCIFGLERKRLLVLRYGTIDVALVEQKNSPVIKH